MEKSYSSNDVCRMTGITYRCLDHWAREGVFVPEIRAANGTGSRREWSATQVDHIKTMWEVHEHLVSLIGLRQVSIDAMHSLSLALREGRPWAVGIFVDEQGAVRTEGIF